MVGAPLKKGEDVIDDQIGCGMWGVVDFGEAGAVVAPSDTPRVEGGLAGSPPLGRFVGGVAVAASGVLMLCAPGPGFCGVSADDAWPRGSCSHRCPVLTVMGLHARSPSLRKEGNVLKACVIACLERALGACFTPGRR